MSETERRPLLERVLETSDSIGDYTGRYVLNTMREFGVLDDEFFIEESHIPEAYQGEAGDLIAQTANDILAFYSTEPETVHWQVQRSLDGISQTTRETGRIVGHFGSAGVLVGGGIAASVAMPQTMGAPLVLGGTVWLTAHEEFGDMGANAGFEFGESVEETISRGFPIPQKIMRDMFVADLEQAALLGVPPEEIATELYDRLTDFATYRGHPNIPDDILFRSDPQSWLERSFLRNGHDVPSHEDHPNELLARDDFDGLRAGTERAENALQGEQEFERDRVLDGRWQYHF